MLLFGRISYLLQEKKSTGQHFRSWVEHAHLISELQLWGDFTPCWVQHAKTCSSNANVKEDRFHDALPPHLFAPPLLHTCFCWSALWAPHSCISLNNQSRVALFLFAWHRLFMFKATSQHLCPEQTNTQSQLCVCVCVWVCVCESSFHTVRMFMRPLNSCLNVWKSSSVHEQCVCFLCAVTMSEINNQLLRGFISRLLVPAQCESPHIQLTVAQS